MIQGDGTTATGDWLWSQEGRARAATGSRQVSVGIALLTTALIGLLTLLVHGIRLGAAPDIYGDEGLYALVATNLAQGRGLLDDSGTFFWHPPLYPLLEATYLQVTGLANADFVTALLSTRWINVAFSAATAGLLFLLGRRLAGMPAGLLMAALFIGDLFVQRINRRSMLESAAMFFVLLAIAIYLRRREVSRRTVLATGACFGIAVLTKEIAAIGLAALLLHALMFDRGRLRPVLGIGAVALAVYSIYPLWVVSIGETTRFLAFKADALTRITRFLGVEIGSDAVPPTAEVANNPSLLERLGSALQEYGPSYALVLVGAVLTVVLFLRYRRRWAAQILICWSAVSYTVIALGQPAALGDQFIYYVIVPAIVVIGYTVTTWLRGDVPAADQAPPSVADVPPAEPEPLPAAHPVADARPVPSRPRPRRFAVIATLAVFAALFAYDGAVWASRYALGNDDSYARITTYVREHIPTGTTIVAGADVSNFLLRPDYDIQFLRTERTVRTAGARYFLISSKEAALGYNRMTPEFYDWVRANTRPLVELDGVTFWTLGLYEWVGPG